MDSIPTAPVSTPNIDTENEISIASGSSPFEYIAEKVYMAAGKAAKERTLEKSVVFQRLPLIDICVLDEQIDHVTQRLTEAITTIGDLKFHFWDTKGIDNWLDIDAVDNLFNEMKEQNIHPIFIIYCAAAGGRVDSDIVAAILKQFQVKKIPICYVITNIYAATSDQLEKQKEGGLIIMHNIFGTVAQATGNFCYEYRSSSDNPDDPASNKQGILIGVNSCPFSNIMGTMPIYNIHELMNFLAGSLNDEDFSKFVALTMKNRDFWDRFSDGFRTRLQRTLDTLSRWKIQTVSFFKQLF